MARERDRDRDRSFGQGCTALCRSWESLILCMRVGLGSCDSVGDIYLRYSTYLFTYLPISVVRSREASCILRSKLAGVCYIIQPLLGIMGLDEMLGSRGPIKTCSYIARIRIG